MDVTETGRLLSGRYRLSAVLGRGGMGVVWQARDELLKRDVAVKEIIWPPHFSEQERQQACRRATREAQMAARLSHVNVVRIYDILEEDGHPWIIMELLPYKSLRDLAAEEGPLTPARAAEVGLGVLAALRAAHAEGIAHRDVKPANILVGPDGRVVLTDFGIARAAGSPTLTTAGTLIGSPSYIAPERARGGRAEAAADLWGLGASLYAAVEGRPPFDRGNAIATLTAVVADDPERAYRAGPLWPVISGLLRKDPGERLGCAETEPMLRRVADGGTRHILPRPWGRKTEAAAEPASPREPRPGAEPGPTGISEPGAAAVAEPGAVADSGAGPAAEADPAGAPGPGASAPAEPESERGPAPSPEEESRLPPLAVLDPAATREPEPAGAPDQTSSGRPGGPASAGPVRHPALRRPPGSRRSRGSVAAVAVLSVVAAAVTAMALVMTGSPRHQAAASGGSSRSAAPPAASPGPASPANTAPAGTGTAPTGASAPGNSAAGKSSGGTSPASPSSAPTANAGYGAVPAGFHRFTNSTGFSIGVPDGWRISHAGHYVYLTDPSNGNIFLLIDQSDHPKPNPLADWQQQQASRKGTYPDYRLIRLESVNYPQAEKAADWEFTYVRNGVLVHILNRNVLANASHAYALYWSAPQSDWDACYHYFQTFAATFRPAPA